LKNESATTKNEIAIARRCGFLLRINFVLIYYLMFAFIIFRLTIQFKMN
jgi:hypothetical protein